MSGLLLLAACAPQSPGVMPDAGSPIEAIEVPVSRLPDIPVQPPASVQRPAPATPLPAPPGIAIVLSGRQAAYESVAQELAKQLDHYTIFDLSDKSQTPATAFRLINDSDAGAVVAIGLPAARVAVERSAKPVVFSQVFNYRAYDLLTERSRGVAALPPLAAHLSAWSDTDPTLRRIGAIIGEGHDELVAEAIVAAENHGVELTIEVARSDQEALYAFRRMAPDIDGFWLFPDNRILSSRSLHEMLALAERRDISVAVSSEAMLDLGATISISSVAENVASTIIDVIRRIEAGQIAQIPELTPLTATRIVRN